MTIEERYFDWLCFQICKDDRLRRSSYEKLFDCLYSIEFVWSLVGDGNRSEEGIDLRSRFAADVGYNQNSIFISLDSNCSVLEMLVALAIRCEENIMADPLLGDRTSQWFWGMIRNLGLIKMSGTHFNGLAVTDIIQKFLDRQYSSSGKGGLFTVTNCDEDLRDVEIWHQMCWYLDDTIGY